MTSRDNMNQGTSFPRQIDWPWPFSRADLMAGLRRFMEDPSIVLDSARPVTLAYSRPSIGRIRGLLVEYQGKGGPGKLNLVVKEPSGSTRTGLAGAGRREVGVYQMLAPQLPVQTPGLVAASPGGDWLVLENAGPARAPENWRAEDYSAAIESLVSLHDRFWGLGEDLNTFAWMGRMLDADFEVHVAAAAQGLQQIVERGQPQPLAKQPERMRMLARLIMHADQIAAPLRELPGTFLHGDFWPGNIALRADGELIVFDWQMAAIGPALLDLLTFVQKSEWWFGELPMSADQLVELYRDRLQARTGVHWDPEQWALLWDHALMWRFLQEWIDLLAASPNILLQAQFDKVERAWLDPVGAALNRRLGQD